VYTNWGLVVEVVAVVVVGVGALVEVVVVVVVVVAIGGLVVVPETGLGKEEGGLGMTGEATVEAVRATCVSWARNMETKAKVRARRTMGTRRPMVR
jgi:hypothetical protein